jgi:hypothetical protein
MKIDKEEESSFIEDTEKIILIQTAIDLGIGNYMIRDFLTNQRIMKFAWNFYKEGKRQTLKDVSDFLKEKTYIQSSNEGTSVSMIKFMPFEWEDFKKELEKSK